ncbi:MULTISPECIES: MerR family transcriptional regulator [Amycolatopsis]|uniref:MerR family transcriptional regulator n=1 Tax=Amycolatopsis TaxID=1813 RepID=UPI001E4E7BD4|nr:MULTISPECIES: helix-turn-helix domain-containing protein [Amycolatopsis]
MGLTIGAFARAAGLSPKALRLYDELGLLRPASVDPVSGYRRYAPDQLERARLIGWLRRTGMPLARISRALAGPDPAAEVLAYWREVEADVAARGRLVAFLVAQLSGKDTAMTGLVHAVRVWCAKRSRTRPTPVRTCSPSPTGSAPAGTRRASPRSRRSNRWTRWPPAIRWTHSGTPSAWPAPRSGTSRTPAPP